MEQNFRVKKGLTLGTGKDESLSVIVDNGETNRPELRYNNVSGEWEYSNNGVNFMAIGSNSGGGSTEVVYLEVTQATHGFDNDFIYHNGTSWVKAQANDSATCATHFAIRVDADNFIAYSMGDIDVTGLLDDAGLALVAGNYYFLSQTVAGKITATNPSSGISQSVMKVNEINKATILIEEPYNIETTVSNIPFAVDSSGTPNLIVGNITNLTSYTDGQVVNIKVANANIGNTTINLNGLGAKNIVLNQSFLSGGELFVGSIYGFVYNETGDYFELFRLGGGGGKGGGIISETNNLTTPSTTWNAVAISDIIMSEISVGTDSMTAGSIDIEIDGVVLDTILSTDSAYTSNFGAESTINIITSSDFAGSSYVNVKYGSGLNQELTKFTAAEQTFEVSVTEDSCAEIIVDGRSGEGVVEIYTDGVKTDYQIANDLLEKIKKGFSNDLGFATKRGEDINFSIYDGVSFSVTAQSFSNSLVFNADYTKFYVLWQGNATIYQYTMGSTSISNSKYDNKSFSVKAQEANPYSMVFNADCTKFYVSGASNATIYQYTMGSTSISNSKYDNKSFSVAAQETQPLSMVFNADYTKFYVLGNFYKTIYQYTMGSTSISNSKYDNKSFSVKAQEANPYSMVFNADCTKFYVLGTSNDTIYQYTMGSTSISNSKYDNKSFSVAAQETQPLSMVFNADYTKFYVLGTSNDTIYQYTMGRDFRGEVFISIEY